jgi:hypothetical protein
MQLLQDYRSDIEQESEDRHHKLPSIHLYLQKRPERAWHPGRKVVSIIG